MIQKIGLTLMVILGFNLGLIGQETAGDTTIYTVVSDMPRFPGCEELDTTAVVIQQCAQANLLNFIYSNVQYPEKARRENIEGTVVIAFVVEKDGTVSKLQALKDIGGGCAEEAMRVLGAMNEIGVRWKPGQKEGEAVRVRVTVPIKFKLEEPPPYVLYGRDTVYVEFDEPLIYEGGDEALSAFLGKNLKYPEVEQDSCYVGEMDVKILVYPNGYVNVLDITDYNDLGPDFQFEAIRAATATMGKWTPAVYQGRRVPTTYDVTMGFFPSDEACQSRVKAYEQAIALANEGSELFNQEEQQEAAIEKLSQAIELFPEHAGFLFIRGQMYMEMERMDEACEDFNKIRGILTNDFINNLVPLLCR